MGVLGMEHAAYLLTLLAYFNRFTDVLGRGVVKHYSTHRPSQNARYDARHNDDHNLCSWKSRTGMRTGKNALHVFSRQARMQIAITYWGRDEDIV